MNSHAIKLLAKGSAAFALVLVGCASASANLLQNGSFELAQGTWTPEGNNTAIWNDNNDGWGTYRDTFGDFTGVTAEDGHHWAGALSYPNLTGALSQLLASPLQAGQSYSVDAWLHQSPRIDLDFAGGYDILLNNAPVAEGGELIGHLGDTGNDTTWQHFSNTFVAPVDAASMPYFVLRVTGQTNAYIGIDNVNLAPVPEPSTLLLVGGGAAAFLRRRKQVVKRNA